MVVRGMIAVRRAAGAPPPDTGASKIWTTIGILDAPRPMPEDLELSSHEQKPDPELLPAGVRWIRTLARRAELADLTDLWVGEAELEGRPVALRLEIGAQGSEGRAELEVLAAVEHPGLARLAAYGHLPGGAGRWVAREWVEGQTLAVWANKRTADEIGSLVAALCPALDHLHSCGFVHGDLKAGNVLVQSDGTPVITDFGLSLKGAATAKASLDPRVSGSTFFIAPEVLGGGRAGERSDLFALGVMLFDLLRPIRITGREFYGRFPSLPFFEAVGAQSIELPAWARDLVERLVERDPDRRPPTAGAVGHILLGRLGGDAVGKAAPSRFVFRWPALRGRESCFDAPPDGSPRWRPAVWWRVLPGEDLHAIADEVVLRDTLAGRSARHLPLEGAMAGIEDERALDLWARHTLAAAAGDRLILTRSADSRWQTRALDVLQRTWAQSYREGGPREVHALGIGDPPGPADIWTVETLPQPSETEILEFLREELEGHEDVRLERLAERLHAECGGLATRLQSLLSDLGESGWLSWVGEKPSLRSGALPDWLGRTRARASAGARKGLGREAQLLLAALSLMEGQTSPVRLERLGRVCDLTEAEIGRALGELLRLSIVQLDARSEGSSVEWARDSLASYWIELDEEDWSALCTREADLMESEGREEHRILPLRYRADANAEVVAAILEEVEQQAAEGQVELALDLLFRVRDLARAAGRSFEPALACSLASSLAAAGEPDRAQAVLAPLPSDTPGAARARAAIARQRNDPVGALRELQQASVVSAVDRAELLLAQTELLAEGRRDDELARLFAELDKHPLGQIPVRLKVNLECRRAMHDFERGEVGPARKRLDAALAEAEQLQDEHRAAFVHLNLGTIERRRGKHDAALKHLQRAHDLYESCGLVTGVARVRLLLGGVRREGGELLEASELMLSALKMRERLGDEIGAAAARGTLGMVEFERGHLHPALQELESSAARLTAGGRLAQAQLLEAMALELHARAGHCPELPAPDEPLLQGEDPRRGLAIARAAWILGDLDLAQRWTARSHTRAKALGRAADVRTATILRREIAGPSDEVLEADQGSAPESDDARVLALLRAETLDCDQASKLAEELELRGRDDRSARLWLAVSSRAPSADLRRRAHRRAQDRLDLCSAGLDETERESARSFLLARPDPCPSDLAARAASHEEEDDMEVLAVLDINHHLVEQRDLPALLGEIVESGLRLTGAERGFLVLEEEGELVLDLALDSRRGDIAEPEVEISRTIVRQALARGEALRLSNATDDPLVGAAPSVSELELRSILVQPFEVQPGLRGVIYLDHRLRSGAFGERAERLLDLLSDQAALAIRQMRQIEEIRRLNSELGRRVAVQETDLKAARRALERVGVAPPIGGLVGDSEAMRRVHELLRRVAPSELAVLVCGPSGSGKELAARALHDHSQRSEGPFVSESCAAIPATLVESELFGHVKGAFTGAEEDREGLFERARGGTLFLDEIGELPLDLQAKLLRVLETREVRRVGQSDTAAVDFRLVAATNRDLAQEVESGNFRSDLYYRLDAMRIELPALAERIDDIPALVDHFLRLESAKGGQERGISSQVLERLAQREWPGNVRELANEVARLCVLSPGDLIEPELVRQARPVGAGRGADAEPSTLADLERRAILDALERTGGDKREAARLLGISRAKIYQRLKDWSQES